MRNKLKTISCLMLAVLCMASFSVTAFASGGDEAATAPDMETVNDTATETGTETSLSLSTAWVNLRKAPPSEPSQLTAVA